MKVTHTLLITSTHPLSHTHHTLTYHTLSSQGWDKGDGRVQLKLALGEEREKRIETREERRRGGEEDWVKRGGRERMERRKKRRTEAEEEEEEERSVFHPPIPSRRVTRSRLLSKGLSLSLRLSISVHPSPSLSMRLSPCISLPISVHPPGPLLGCTHRPIRRTASFLLCKSRQICVRQSVREIGAVCVLSSSQWGGE